MWHVEQSVQIPLVEIKTVRTKKKNTQGLISSRLGIVEKEVGEIGGKDTETSRGELEKNQQTRHKRTDIA